ncbi:MAG TPA: hypothetical protein VK028_12845 [Micromonosporaceae bacterium]|nr:hypothetical protein [Micromonosporaceae bacterium]
MRRVVGLAGLGVLLAMAVACTNQPPAAPVGNTQSPSPTASATPSPTPTPDPFITNQICDEAKQAIAAASAVINEQLALLEKAAADGDQAGMVQAAEAINTQFTSLSDRFATQAKVASVSPAVQDALADVSAALAEMASPRYVGTQVDIKRKMIDFEIAFVRACGDS